MFFSFDAAVGRSPLSHLIEASKDSYASALNCTIAAGSLPAGRTVHLYNLKTGILRKGVSSSDSDLGLSIPAKVGDRMLLIVEPVLSSGSQILAMTFDRRVEKDPPTFLQDRLTEADVQLNQTDPSQGSLTPRLDVSGDIVFIEPETAWRAGASYELTLLASAFENLGAEKAHPIVLPFKVADAVSGNPMIDGLVADVALEGDVLLVAGRDQGLTAWDISNPEDPAELGRAETEIAVAGVASDGFGHVISLEGKVNQHVALRLYRFEDLAPEGDDPVDPAPVLAVQELSRPLTSVGPGDLRIEVFSNQVNFTAQDAVDGLESAQGISATLNGTEDGWTEMTIPENLMKPYHPVILHDAVTGRVLRRRVAPASGPLVVEYANLELDGDEVLPLNYPIRLRAHTDTLVWAHASAGATALSALDFSGGGHNFALVSVAQNEDLLGWFRHPDNPNVPCRELGSADSVYLGRIAVSRPEDGDPTLLAASRYEGVWGIRRSGGTLKPDWIDCVRSSSGSDLTDIDVARLSFNVDGQWEEKTVVGVVGHRTLNYGEVGVDGKVDWGRGYALGWSASHVAIDPIDRLIVVRDSDSRLAVFSLDGTEDPTSWSVDLVADIKLPSGSGMGPLVINPTHGIAVTGSAPVQYKPPVIEMVGPDTDGDGIRERIEYLQPLGAPEAPEAETGEKAPYLAWVTARIVGIPDHQNSIKVRVEGLAPGGGVVPDRPEPFLPSSTEVELRRQTGLRLDDPARHNFIAAQPILLIADERARADYWTKIPENGDLRNQLEEQVDGTGHYAVCRNCDRDDLIIPEGIEPIELASAYRIRVSLKIDETSSSWLQGYVEAGLVPTDEAVTLPWMPSPPVGRDPGIEARGAMVPEVELSTGALTLARTDLALPAPGMDVVVGRQYSSAGILFGLFGWGWELSGLDRLRPNPDGTVDLFTSSGDRYVFGKSASGHPTAAGNPLTAWAHPGELKRRAGGGWLMLTPDGGYTEYSAEGLPTRVRDRYRKNEEAGSELKLLWYADGTLAQIVQSNGTRSTELKPRTMIFNYEDEDSELGDGNSPPGLVTSVEDSAGRTYLYAYDDSGRMQKAGIKGVQLAYEGSPGDVIETYTKDASAKSSVLPMDLERGDQIKMIEDSKGNVLIDVDWEEGRVQKVTRGRDDATGPAIDTTITEDSETQWTIVEGVTPAGPPTLTQISLVENGSDGWDGTVTVGGVLTTSTQIDKDGRLRSVRDPAGISTTTVYYDGHRRYSFLPEIVTTTPGTVGDESPVSTLMTRYDYVDGQISLIERSPGPSGPITTSIQRPDPQTVITRAPDGTQTTRYLDQVGRVSTQTSSTGASNTLDFDDTMHGSGELELSISTSTVGTATTRIGRNLLGHAESSYTFQTTNDGGTQPLPRSTTTQSNDLGWTLRTTSGETETRTAYDTAGRIQSISSGTGGGGATTTVPGYTSAGMISSITRSQNGVTESNGMSYDDAGRLWTSTKAGVETAYLYDSAGRTDTRTERWTEDDAGGTTFELVTGYGYEPGSGRLLTTTTPGGKVWTNQYDRLGRQTGRSDLTGVREVLTFSPDGRLFDRELKTGLEEAEKLWAWEEFGYDAIGRQRTHSVHRFPLGQAYDPDADEVLTTTTKYFETSGPKLGLVEWIEDPLDRRTSFDYDDAGREILRTLPDGSIVETGYYPDGKVRTRTVSFDEGETSWALTTTTVYDEQGRVHQVTGPGGRTTTTFYDSLGRKERVLTPDSNPSVEGEQATHRLTKWTYGDLGRVVTETRPDGAEITRTYDERGNLVAYEDHEGNTTTYRYYKNGRLKAIVYPDDSERSFTYHPDGEMAGIKRADQTLVTFAIDTTTGRLDTVTASADQPGGTVDFDYDEIGHLTSAFDNDVRLGFTWDSVGNQLSESLGLPVLGFGERDLEPEYFDDANRPWYPSACPTSLANLVRGYDSMAIG